SQGNERWAGHIGPQEIPTAVTLADFAAAVSGDSVEITWQTVSELDNTGFNLYRSQSPAAPDILLAFVPSQAPGSAQGFDYTYRDADVVGGETYWYWLEDVDVSGVATLHGPVSVAVGIPAAVTLASLQADPIPAHNLPLWLPVAFLVLLGGLAVLRRRRRGYL
ncbi:MAG: hypothetical protein KDH89_05735, partial [Anaerolineae bacterium]|nr:hypothetical protein [Anaerolineae bacterium]